MPIRLKITILFLAVALIPLLLVSGLTYNSYKNSLQKAYLLRLEDLATSRADQIEQYFTNLKTPAAEADLTPIYKFISNVTSLGATGETLIGKKQGGQFVYLNPLRHEPGVALNKVMNMGGVLAGPMQEALQGKSGAGELIDYRGKKVVAAWHYIPSLGWGVVAKIDSQEAYAEVENFRNLILLILGIIFIVSGIMAFSFARSISGPINTLAKGAEIVGAGDLDYKIALNSKDEIGQLAVAFNKMTRDLKLAGASRDAERQRLFGVLEALPVYVILLSEDYHVPFANRFFRERFGESGGKRCYEYLFKRIEPCENCESYKVVKTHAPHHWEWTGPDKRNYDIYDFPFIDSDGSRMILEMGIDITAQKQAQERLRMTSQYARSLIEASLDPLVTISSEGKITDVNEATIRATGMTREELVGTDFSTYFTEPEKAQAGYRQVFAKGFVTDYPLTIRQKDGRLIDVLYNASVYKDTHGNVLGVFAAARDVTLLKQANELLNLEIIERKNVEKEIRARNALLRLAAKANSRKEYLDAVVKLLRGWSRVRCVGIRLLGEDGTIPYEAYVGFSREFWEKENRLSVQEDKCLCICAITGEFRAEDTGIITPYGSFYCGDTGGFIAKLSETQKSQLRGQCIREGFKSLTLIPIRFKEKVIGVIHFADETNDLPVPKVMKILELLAMRIGEDIVKFNLADRVQRSIVKRKETEEELTKTKIQLVEAKRLSDIGTLAATVAHELRNPLAAIQMASYNIKRKAQNPILDRHLLTIENKVNESEQIISNLLFYSRLKPPRYENIAIYQIIDECVAHVKNHFAKEKVALQVNLNPLKQISIQADPLQIREVFGNILNNAYESQTREEKRVEVKAKIDNGYIEVMVKDAGEGIDEENLERVFDPFFTTKARGTGLGLTVCKQIINFHGGSIDIKSEKGKGTLVSIKLPVKKESA